MTFSSFFSSENGENLNSQPIKIVKMRENRHQVIFLSLVFTQGSILRISVRIFKIMFTLLMYAFKLKCAYFRE